MKTFKGNIEITSANCKEWQKKLKGVEKIGGYLSINSQAKLEAKSLKSVGGYLSINSQAKLDSLKSVGGDLYINSQAKLEAKSLKSVGGYLYINSQAKLEAKSLKSVGGYLSINSPISRRTNELINRLLKERKKRKLYINRVNFKKSLFNKVRLDKLTAQEVFALENMEQRRIAYQLMDKTKMKKLKDYKVVDKVEKDDYGYPMRIISFQVKGYDTPFKFLNCFCPSEGREYFLETDKDKCVEAKYGSFGLDYKKYKFSKEY